MLKAPERKWIADRVARIREARRSQGHDLWRLQQGIIETIAAWDPVHEPSSRKELSQIEEAVRTNGRWAAQEEWRIMTYFHSTIVRSKQEDAENYEVIVECDGQKLSCSCPTLEGAYAFMRLYQAMIVDQFYTVGPPWAAAGLFKS